MKLSNLKSEDFKGGRPTKIYMINELQATFLMTLLINSNIIVEFKLELVKKFYMMRQLLREKIPDSLKECMRTRLYRRAKGALKEIK